MGMYDNSFEFSNNQALATLDSTGVVSTNVWDLENSASGAAMNQTDFMVYGWVHFIILSTTNTTGNNFRITLVSSSTAALTGTLKYLGGTELLTAQIVAGNKFSFGVCLNNCEQFLGIWYKSATSLTGATGVDCYFTDGPLTSPNDVANQKRPNSSFG
jgi:hypothetical protein